MTLGTIIGGGSQGTAGIACEFSVNIGAGCRQPSVPMNSQTYRRWRVLPALKLAGGAADAGQDDIEGSQHGQAVQQPSPLAQDVIDYEVVPGLGHACDRPVEPGPGPGQNRVKVCRFQLQGSCLRPHGIDGVDGQVKLGPVEHQQKLLGDARLA
jgi:hypothetical protein